MGASRTIWSTSAEISREGLVALDRGTDIAGVVWEWRAGFDHWGHHLVDALRALHWQLIWT